VLDPFIGVGTTAIAALMHNRKAIGADIVLEYVEIAKERIRLAEKGALLIRPMERSVYDPDAPEASVPPKSVHLGSNSIQSNTENNWYMTLND
jgi:adenine-specific DNA-methyltransferase